MQYVCMSSCRHLTTCTTNNGNGIRIVCVVPAGKAEPVQLQPPKQIGRRGSHEYKCSVNEANVSRVAYDIDGYSYCVRLFDCELIPWYMQVVVPAPLIRMTYVRACHNGHAYLIRMSAQLGSNAFL